MLKKYLQVSLLCLIAALCFGLSNAFASGDGGCKSSKDCSGAAPSCNTSTGKCECNSSSCGEGKKCEAGICKSTDGSCGGDGECSGSTPSCVNKKCECNSTSCGSGKKCVNGSCKIDGACVLPRIKGKLKQIINNKLSCATEETCIMPADACS